MPAGRPKGAKNLAGQVRAKMLDGMKLIEFYEEILDDKQQATRDRIEVAKLLEYRGWGRPAQAEENSDVPETYAEALMMLRARLETKTLVMIDLSADPIKQVQALLQERNHEDA